MPVNPTIFLGKQREVGITEGVGVITSSDRTGLESGQEVPQSVYEASTTQVHEIGTKLAEFNTGREFIYAQAGAVQLDLAEMTVGIAPVDGHRETVQTGHTWAIGDLESTVLTTAAVTADQYKDGWMVVNKGTGISQAYPIATNTAHATTPTVTLKAGHPIVLAVPATAEITLVQTPFLGTIIAPTATVTSSPAGIPLITVAASSFYWSCVKGPAPWLVDTGDTLLIGNDVSIGITAAGTCSIMTTLKSQLGKVLTVAIAAEPALVYLNLGY